MLVDAADVASLLKKYLRDLPDSLFMAKNEANFNSIMNFGTLEQRKAAYLALVVQLPAVNQAVIKRLLFYLTQARFFYLSIPLFLIHSWSFLSAYR